MIGRWRAEFLEAGSAALVPGWTGPSTWEQQLEAEVADLPQTPGEAAVRIGVLPPETSAPATAIAADPDRQDRGPMPERLICQPAHHRAQRDTLRSAPPAQIVGLDHTTLDHRPSRLPTLPDGHQAEVVEAAERREVKVVEGSAEHPVIRLREFMLRAALLRE